MRTRSLKAAAGRASKAARQAQASAKSMPLPLLRIDAGDKLMVTLQLRHSSSELPTAALTRSLASLTAVSRQPDHRDSRDT